jgi:hypothetical protein
MDTRFDRPPDEPRESVSIWRRQTRAGTCSILLYGCSFLITFDSVSSEENEPQLWHNERFCAIVSSSSLSRKHSIKVVRLIPDDSGFGLGNRRL